MAGSPPPSVVVIGSYNQDLTWRCESFPVPGETIFGRFVTGPGGKGSNQAVAAARAGAATRFIGAVGNDVFGAQAAAFHRTEGIDSHFIVKARHPTGTAGILVNRPGQNEIVVAPGANAAIRPADVPERLIRGARVVVCQNETTLEMNARAFALARAVGALTVLNPAPMRADFDRRLLATTDVLIPNETEFSALTRLLPACRIIARAGSPVAHNPAARQPAAEEWMQKLPDPVLHALARAMGPATVIVTLGERGCLVSQADGYFCVPAFKGIRVVDTTGAGDAFVGGFAAGLVRFDGDMRRAAHFANAVAALSVTKAGTAPSMPSAPAIARFLKRHPAI